MSQVEHTARLPRTRSILAHLESAGSGVLFAVIAGPLLLIYLATASWSQPYHIDAFTNVLSAWNVGTHGSFLLDDHTQLASPDYYGNVAWIVPVDGSAASQYPPGTTLLAAPLYALWPGEAVVVDVGGTNRPDVPAIEMIHPPLAPAAIVASATVALAMGFLGLVFLRVGATPVMALGAAYLAGLGSTAWSVAADRLWQHGPGMMWLALALLLAERRSLASGLAYGAAILTRPPTAVIAAATGLVKSWGERTPRAAVLTGIGAAVGLAAFLAYNNVVFGNASISAGYGDSFQSRAVSRDLLLYAKNVFLGAVSATRGFLIWSPFLVLLIPGLRAAWRTAAPWVRGAGLGGLLYLLLQYKANRYSGGSGFFAYRYPLEALVAAAPLLYLSFTQWVAPRPRLARAFAFLAKASIAMHAVGAVL